MLVELVEIEKAAAGARVAEAVDHVAPLLASVVD